MEKQTVSRVDESSQKEKPALLTSPLQIWKHLDVVAEKLAQILCHRRSTRNRKF